MPERFYRQLESLHVGCEEPRSYFVPFEKTQPVSTEREASRRFTLLDGEWDFAYFGDVEKLELEREDFPETVTCPDKMTVPFCWQLALGRGYDVPNYINQDYPFPVDPPYLPDEIPCGFYRRSFSLAKKENKRYYVNFEGVSSCFYLWINGSFIGYSQVSHCTSEMEITGAVREGENTAEVLVVKHCTGSYMEDQDFFRLSGIFRSVYLLERDRCHVRDIFVVDKVAESLKEAELSVKTEAVGQLTIDWELRSPEGELVGRGSSEGDFTVKIQNPCLWNWEEPKLYRLDVFAGEERITLYPGLKRLEIKNRTLLLNGQKIKLKGINRHDSNPETGYAVSVEDMLEDLMLLKRANVNTIRTSHYPNDPRFVEMCDRLGFMLIDEADLECHGMGYNYGDWYWDYWAHLCDTPEWEESCLDRARRLFERDKNNACVIMWSLGNESGCGENHRKMANLIRSRRSDVIIHYENARLEYEERVNRDFKDISDLESRMYASLEYLKEYLNDEKQTKPFFYCEYVAAWTTGDIPLHWEEFEDYDNYAGGCVWEFCDHAVNIGTKENPRYRYGGDFGDYPNDHVYCVDGLVYPDRKPRPGYYDMKITYQPFSCELSEGVLKVKNKRFFTCLCDLELFWRVEKNGKPILSGSIGELNLKPQQTGEYRLFDSIEDEGLLTVIVSVKQREKTPWADAGYEMGHSQFVLQREPVSLASQQKSGVSLQEGRTELKVLCGDTAYTFSKLNGKLVSAVKAGKELLLEPMELDIFRSSHPGNGHEEQWSRARYGAAKQKAYSLSLRESTDSSVTLEAQVSLSAAALPPALRARVLYTVTEDGVLNVSVCAEAHKRAPAFPRLGLRLVLPREFERLEYLGYGPGESYCDRYKSQLLSSYSTTAEENFEHYVVPTECSAHYGTLYARVTDKEGRGMAFADTEKQGFVFCAKHYSDAQLQSVKHDDELADEHRTIVNLDAFQQADCPEYKLKNPTQESRLSFSFNIILQ